MRSIEGGSRGAPSSRGVATISRGPSLGRSPEARISLGGSRFGAAERASRPAFKIGGSARSEKMSALRATERPNTPIINISKPAAERGKTYTEKQRVTNAQFRSLSRPTGEPRGLDRVQPQLQIENKHVAPAPVVKNEPAARPNRVSERPRVRVRTENRIHSSDRRAGSILRRNVGAPRSVDIWAQRGLHRTDASVRKTDVALKTQVEKTAVQSVQRPEERRASTASIMSERQTVVPKVEYATRLVPARVLYQRQTLNAPTVEAVQSVDPEEIKRRLQHSVTEQSSTLTVPQTDRGVRVEQPARLEVPAQTQLRVDRLAQVRTDIAALPAQKKESIVSGVTVHQPVALESSPTAAATPLKAKEAQGTVVHGAALTEASSWRTKVAEKGRAANLGEKSEYAEDGEAQEVRVSLGKAAIEIATQNSKAKEVTGAQVEAVMPNSSSAISGIIRLLSGSQEQEDGSLNAVRSYIKGMGAGTKREILAGIKYAVVKFPAVLLGKGRKVSEEDVRRVFKRKLPGVD